MKYKEINEINEARLFKYFGGIKKYIAIILIEIILLALCLRWAYVMGANNGIEKAKEDRPKTYFEMHEVGNHKYYYLKIKIDPTQLECIHEGEFYNLIIPADESILF